MRKQLFPDNPEEKRDFVLKITIVDGLSSVWVQYLALPSFGVLFKLIVDAESGNDFISIFIYHGLSVGRACRRFLHLSGALRLQLFLLSDRVFRLWKHAAFHPPLRGADGYLHPVHHHGQHQRIQPYLDEWKTGIDQTCGKRHRNRIDPYDLPNSTTAMHGLNGGTAYFMLRYYWTHNDTKNRYPLFI